MIVRDLYGRKTFIQRKIGGTEQHPVMDHLYSRVFTMLDDRSLTNFGIWANALPTHQRKQMSDLMGNWQ